EAVARSSPWRRSCSAARLCACVGFPRSGSSKAWWRDISPEPVLKCIPLFRAAPCKSLMSFQLRQKESIMSSTLSTRTRSRGLLLGVLALVLALCVWLPACSAQAKDKMDKMASDPNKVLAKVNGKSITQADIEKAAAPEFAQLERECSNNRHTLVENKLKQLVQDTMVEAEAKAKGVSKDQLIADATKAAAVTDADVNKFYDDNKAQIPPNVTK